MPDFTQQQTDQQQRLAQELSLKRTQPPGHAPGYRTEAFVGSGAFGEVWRAVDCNTGRQVAIKFFTHRGHVDWSLLRREVEKLVYLAADRYVVQLLDVGWDADPPYYVMDFIPEGSLEDYLSDGRVMRVHDAVEMVREIAVGLMHLHGKGVLHCDLKPANVLLDQDRKPRLADFGQSRLTHEQQPALGTLFYMAPEQADLSSTPDARWDVYALGALLYRMLTGEPPHKTAAFVEQIDSAKDLPERLDRYRRLLERSPPPREHRRIAGVDRSLAEIVDRCLKANPRDRFPSVQSVLEALRARDQQRERRPLLVLGLAAPLLLLAVMAFFGWLGYRGAVDASDVAVAARVRESNEYAAKFVAANVSRDLQQYFHQVEQVAASDELRTLMRAFYADEQMQAALRVIADPRASSQAKDAARSELFAHPAQQALQQYVEALAKKRPDLHASSWITTDSLGTHLADIFEVTPERSPVGYNYAYRAYFSGRPADMAPEKVAWPNPQRLTDVYLSPVFQSTATNTWKVAVSAPVLDGPSETFLGVIAVTVEMGQFANSLQESGASSSGDGAPLAELRQFAVLLGGRTAAGKAVILQHPLFDELLPKEGRLPAEFTDSRYQVRLDDPALATLAESGGREVSPASYQDPLSAYPAGEALRKEWIAATAVVPLPKGSRSAGGAQESGLFVLVQEDRDSAIAPVHSLASRLMNHALFATAGVIAVIVGVWILVVRMLSFAQSAMIQDASSARPTPTPLHSAETMPAGAKT